MIKIADELHSEVFEKRFGGEGEGRVTRILEVEQMKGKGRVFARMMLKPGSTLGYHQHNGDFETYYIISGEGIVNDNGNKRKIKAGDVVYTENGEFHGLENTGTDNLEYIALVLFV